jgi:hypothetical protein
MSPNDIYEALRQSHDIQRAWCARLTRTRASNPQGRTDALLTLKLELAAHAAAEERFLYAPIMMDDAGLDSARHALSEHHEIDELVADLGQLATDGDAWSEKAKALAHEVRHHLKEEEHGFFQVSGKILTAAQKQRLARQYLRDYTRMKKKLAGDWGLAAERATRTDTAAARQARRTPAATPARRVAKVAAALAG